jgi:Holliday junction resolvase RusA-like endonuclease
MKITVVVPWSASASKNASHRFGSKRVWMPQGVKNWHAFVQLEIRKALKGTWWLPRKTWFSLMVCKPNNRSDAINLVDLAADAIKRAIGVDDRWFSIGQVDWEIDAENPRIVIEVWQ